jgi:hypothetical protein
VRCQRCTRSLLNAPMQQRRYSMLPSTRCLFPGIWWRAAARGGKWKPPDQRCFHVANLDPSLGRAIWDEKKNGPN